MAASLPNDLLGITGLYSTFKITTEIAIFSPGVVYRPDFWRSKVRAETRDIYVEADAINPIGWSRYHLIVTSNFYGILRSLEGHVVRSIPDRYTFLAGDSYQSIYGGDINTIIAQIATGELYFGHRLEGRAQAIPRVWRLIFRALPLPEEFDLIPIREPGTCSDPVADAEVLIITERNELWTWCLGGEFGPHSLANPVQGQVVDAGMTDDGFVYVLGRSGGIWMLDTETTPIKWLPVTLAAETLTQAAPMRLVIQKYLRHLILRNGGTVDVNGAIYGTEFIETPQALWYNGSDPIDPISARSYISEVGGYVIDTHRQAKRRGAEKSTGIPGAQTVTVQGLVLVD